MANFEVFDRRTRPVSNQATVTIQKRGNFSLNRAAFVALEEPEAVELLYDRVEKLIGMRKAEVTNPIAYPVRKQQNAASYLVAGNLFAQFYGIPVGVTRRWDVKMMGNVLAIDLKEEGREVMSRRRQSQPQ